MFSYQSMSGSEGKSYYHKEKIETKLKTTGSIILTEKSVKTMISGNWCTWSGTRCTETTESKPHMKLSNQIPVSTKLYLLTNVSWAIKKKEVLKIYVSTVALYSKLSRNLRRIDSYISCYLKILYVSNRKFLCDALPTYIHVSLCTPFTT